MIPADAPDHLKSKYLLSLFVADVAKKLEEEAIAAIRPAVRAAAQKAAADLQPTLESMHDLCSRGMVHHLIIKEVK